MFVRLALRLAFICFLFSVLSCGTTQFLGEDEAFLVKNKMVFKGEVKFRSKRLLRQELYYVYKLKPNENFLWVPKEWFYYKLQDTTGRSNFLKRWRSWEMKQFGEQPALLDEELLQATARAMEYYMQGKGFFKARVAYHVDYTGREGKRAVVTYEIAPGPLYRIRQVEYRALDSLLAADVKILERTSLLRGGEPMEESLYRQEVARIVNYFRNNGYARFQARYLSDLEADSVGQTLNLRMDVLPPTEGAHHRRYHVGNIYIYPDYKPTEQSENQIDSLQPGIFFVSDSGRFDMKPEVLLQALAFQPGELYKQSKIDKTRRQLDRLSIFNFVSIKEVPSNADSETLDFHLYLTRAKKYELGGDLEVNTSNNQLLGRRLFGVVGDVSLRNRNLFHQATHAVLRFNGGSDISVPGLLDGEEDAVNAIDIGSQFNMYFPHFTDFLGLWKAGDALGLYGHDFYPALKEKADTRWTFSYSYLKQIDFYTINSLNAQYGFDFHFDNEHFLQVNHLGVNYLSPQTTLHFDTLILRHNPFLQRSFDKQLFTGFLLKELSYAFNGRPNTFGESYFFKGSLELSGLEVLGANVLYNVLSKAPDRQFALRLPNEEVVDFSQFVRLELAVGHHRRFSPRQAIALRAYVGLAFPVGFTRNVPYVKQFYVGGPQSIRAWLAREIGPGGYIDSLTLNPDSKNPLLLYQTGDVKIEMNAEYRFQLLNIFGVKFEGATFLDVGNVYTLKADPTRPFSQLLWTPRYDENQQKTGDNLFRYMAVGSGVGLRIDVTYFILRFDLGLKLRNPYPSYEEQDGQRREIFWRDLSHWKRFDWQLMKQDLNLNLSLNYPF